MKVRVPEITAADRNWVMDLLTDRWGSTHVIRNSELVDASRLAGFIAHHADQRVGLLTYLADEFSCEIVTFNSLTENQGTGSALLTAAIEASKSLGLKRLWLVTTNDNRHALRFYQKRGFHIYDVKIDVMSKNRVLKPELPLLGRDGIEIRDEIYLEKRI